MFSDTMLKRLQPFMRQSSVYKEILIAQVPQYNSREEAIADLQAQMTVNTATWALSIYEREYGIRTDPSKSIQERRAAIIAKMRGTGKFSTDMAVAIASAFTDRVRKASFNGRIRLHFESVEELNLMNIAAALEEVKPAHLDVEYDMGNLMPIEITENIVVTQRRYHKVSEFRVGMQPMKYQSEVTI